MEVQYQVRPWRCKTKSDQGVFTPCHALTKLESLGILRIQALDDKFPIHNLEVQSPPPTLEVQSPSNTSGLPPYLVIGSNTAQIRLQL